jgi:NADH-quinone oxidoreductase subunit H
MPHIWVTIIQVPTFFGKVLFVCFLQAFVRWSLPRFRYDQLMKIGWRVLLPASLANIFATGTLVLAFDRGGITGQAGLKVLADATQALVVFGMVALLVLGIVGMAKPMKRSRWIVGSSAKFAMARGGTKQSPMQA